MCIAAYFALLTWPALGMHFAPDDMQNMYRYWSSGVWRMLEANLIFVTSYYRPMGGLFYMPIYKLFGFDPLPYRVVLYAMLWVNVWLLYCLARRITLSRETAAFATLFGCFHGSVAGVYMSNAMIYEVACFTFFIGALLYYVRIRRSGLLLAWRQIAVLCVLFAGALNSKEMAVVLPAVLVVYELVFRGWRRPSLRVMMPLLVTGAMAAAYMGGKLFGKESLTKVQGYRPEYSIDRFLETSSTYAGYLLLSDKPLSDEATNAFWIVLAVLALVLRRKSMMFGVAFAFLAYLPLNFVEARQGFVLYIPLLGFAIYAADFVSAVLDYAQRWTRLSEGHRAEVAAMLFVVCLVSLGIVHGQKSSDETEGMRHAQDATWNVIQEFKRVHPRVRPGAAVLLADSPIENDWDIYFIAKLFFDDRTLRASWVRSKNPVAYGDAHDHFDHELRFEGNRLIQVR